MLGPGVVCLGVPTALACAIRAVGTAPDRLAAWVALGIAIAGAALLAWGVVRILSGAV